MPIPLEYGTVHLYDELKHLALQQKIDKAQLSKSITIAELASRAKIATLNDAEYKRIALFTKESIERSFGIQAALRKTGLVGKFFAFLIDLTSNNSKL